ncbi:MAG: hypothetical protein PUE33_03980 [bacterium]|nr:hypothetical protein [bacterium]
MNEEEKIHINSFKFYDRDELEDLAKQYYLENQQLKEQLEKSEKVRKSGIDYLTSYESISTIQSLDNIEQNKGLDEKTMNEMIRRYSVVHDEVLKMLDIKDSDK